MSTVLGLIDRGALHTGFAADIVVFDPERVRSTATFEEPRQYPEGIHYAIVNGKIVIDQAYRSITGTRSAPFCLRATLHAYYYCGCHRLGADAPQTGPS